MPFRSGTTTVSGPTAFFTDSIAPSRSYALQLSRMMSNGSAMSFDRIVGGHSSTQVAERAAQFQPALREPLGAPLAHEEGHVPACVEQPPAEIPADRPRAHHQNPHVLLLC